MAKNVLFMIHGMGEHMPGWSTKENGPIPTLCKVANDYSGFTDQEPLEREIEFVEISYDDIFSGISSKWADLSASISAKLPEATPDAITDIATKLEQPNESDNWPETCQTYSGIEAPIRGA